MTKSRDQYLQAADRIGSRICRDAWWSGTACNWFGWSSAIVNGDWTPVFQALGSSEHNPLAGINIYSGTSGIALFFARLIRVTGDPHQTRTLQGAVHQILGLHSSFRNPKSEIRNQAESINQRLGQQSSIRESPGFGFYAGRSGIGYALVEAGLALEDQAVVDRGLDELSELRHLEPRPDQIDVLEGSAGLIPVLLDIAKRFDRADLADIAIRHGRHLLQLACETDEGWSWDTIPIPVHKHLTGFSHGVSGVVFAMLELFRATRDSDFLQAAQGGMEYERNQFHVVEQNWLDHQIHETAQENAPQCRTAWCHGAPGIGLARLAAHALIPHDAPIRNDLEIALATTTADIKNFGRPGERDWCLCHGQAGNADLLLLASDTLSDDKYRAVAESLGDWGIDQIQNSHLPWPSGIGGTGECPDLMTGVSGVGYFYLRLYDSVVTPSVLLVPSR